MKILSVKIKNILSIEDATIDFDDSGLMLVQGWNHDVGRANGAGKTAIFNAITFALFDKLPRKVTATEILRRGSKSGYVEVSLQNSGKNFAVKRSRPKGVTFSEDGSPRTITQSEWENQIGLNYNQFVISMYCAQGTTTRFLSLNDADKKQFILQLLNLEEFSACKAVSDGKVKNLDTELVTLKGKENMLAAKIDAYSESLIDENVYAHHINLTNESIVKLSSDLQDNKLLSKPDFSKFATLEANIVAKRAEFAGAKMKREMLHDQYRRINSKIYPFAESTSCASCGSKIDRSAAEIAHNRNIESAKAELLDVKKQIETCDEVLSKENSVNDLASKLTVKKKEESKDYENALQKTSELESKLIIKQRELRDLTLKLQNNSELQSKIKVLATEEQEVLNKKLGILSDIELYKTISAVYSPTGAQAYILDSVIDSFNEQVVNYVNLLWTNMTYSLQSYKENVKGEVTAKFSENLMMDGKPISIGSLSGGEFRALSLCVDFALIDVMERQFGISMSPIILDEPFDGLDGIGREVIIDLLEAIGQSRQVVVIDHTSEVKSMFSKVLTVEKRSGVSSVKLET